MRSGVNNGNIKLCCRVLNDYRKLIESIMHADGERWQGKDEEKWGKPPVVEGVQYMTYYAHIAYVKQVSSTGDWPRLACVTPDPFLPRAGVFHR